VDQLRGEYRRFIRKAKELDPNCFGVPGRPHAYQSKRKLDQTTQNDSRDTKIINLDEEFDEEDINDNNAVERPKKIIKIEPKILEKEQQEIEKQETEKEVILPEQLPGQDEPLVFKKNTKLTYLELKKQTKQSESSSSSVSKNALADLASDYGSDIEKPSP